MLIFSLSILLLGYPIWSQNIQTYIDQIQAQTTLDSIKIDAYKQLWRHYINADLDSANHYAAEGLKFAEHIEYPRGIADLSVYFAFGIMNKGNLDAALRILKEKLNYLQSEHTFLNGELYLTEWIGNFFRENNQLDSATHYYQIMLERAQGTHYHNLIGVHSGLGQLYQQQQFYESAIYHFQMADSICKTHQVDNNVCTGCRSNTAQMLIEVGDLNGAQEYFNQAKLDYERRKEYYLINELKLYEADLKIIDNEMEEAFILANEAVDFFAKDSSILMWIKSLNRAYQASWSTSDLSVTENITEQLLSLNHLLQDSLRLADAYSKYAFLLAQKGSLPESLEAVKIASNYLADHDDLNIRLNITKNYVVVYDLLGDHKQALQAQTEWATLMSELNSRSNARMVKEMEIAYDIQNKDQEIALLTAQNQLIVQEQKNQKNLMYAGIGLFLILIGFLYFLFRNKQQVNKRLRDIDHLKSQLFANISHELRTPLTLIQGPINRLLSAGQIDDKVGEQLEMISRNADRLKRLITNVSNLSRIEEGELSLNIKPGFLGHHVNQITKAFQYLSTSKSIQFTLNNEVPIKAYYYDPEYLETILYNLIGNAFKYTEQGSITVSTYINQGIFSAKVMDTGAGVPPEEQKIIFARYRRGSKIRPETKGVGLGLSLSRELAEKHHGKIELLNTSTSGSTFLFTAPVNKTYFEEQGISITNTLTGSVDSPNDKSTIHRKSANIHPDDPLILLVEDNPDMQLYIHQVFDHDYRILTANNGLEGWELASKYIPDIIVSDLMMPAMDGNGLLNKLREDSKTSHIPFIMLTANHQEAAKLDSLKYGADDFMTKPFSEEELRLKVKNQIAIREVLLEKYLKHGNDPSTSSSQRFLDADQEFWNRLEEVVKSNLDNVHFTAEDFAKSMLISRMQLHRKLKALTNLSASAFMRDRRLKEGAKLMKEKSMTVSEVAYAVGFSSPFYFSKCFKEMFNQVPTKYAG